MTLPTAYPAFGSAIIVGGTIDNTVIGGTTPAAGSFTTLNVSGTSTFAVGAEATPSLTFTGRTSTGIYSPADGRVSIVGLGKTQMRWIGAGTEVDFWDVAGSSGGSITMAAAGNSSNISQFYTSKGSGTISLCTGGSSNRQVLVSHTVSPVNYLTLTGGATGATVTIGTGGSDTDRSIAINPGGAGILSTTAPFVALSGTAIPAGGTAGAGVRVSSTSNFGVFFGSGAPSLSAAKGSLYLRSDGSGTADRLYVNTNGATTWTNVVTAA